MGDGEVIEIDETNNRFETYIGPIAPDLELHDDVRITGEKEKDMLEADPDTGKFKLHKGEKYTITLTVGNMGEYEARDLVVNLRISRINKDGIDEIEMERNTTIEVILAGENETVKFVWVPREYDAEYIIELEVDPANVIMEVKEKNNIISFSSVTKKAETKEEPGFEVVSLLVVLTVLLLFYYRKRR